MKQFKGVYPISGEDRGEARPGHPLMPSASPTLGVCVAGWDLDASRHSRLAP